MPLPFLRRRKAPAGVAEDSKDLNRLSLEKELEQLRSENARLHEQVLYIIILLSSVAPDAALPRGSAERWHGRDVLPSSFEQACGAVMGVPSFRSSNRMATRAHACMHASEFDPPALSPMATHPYIYVWVPDGGGWVGACDRMHTTCMHAAAMCSHATPRPLDAWIHPDLCHLPPHTHTQHTRACTT